MKFVQDRQIFENGQEVVDTLGTHVITLEEVNILMECLTESRISLGIVISGEVEYFVCERDEYGFYGLSLTQLLSSAFAVLQSRRSLCKCADSQYIKIILNAVNRLNGITDIQAVSRVIINNRVEELTFEECFNSFPNCRKIGGTLMSL